MVDDRALQNALRVFATRSVEECDLDVVCDELAELARSALRLTGAGVTVKVRQGAKELRYLTATDDATLHLERAQERFAEGPCVDAIEAGAPAAADDIRQCEQRWPRYAPAVAEAGFRQVAGLPMVHAGRVVGALDAYRAEPGRWTREELEAGMLFAGVATSYIANACAYAEQATVAAQLQYALDSRVIIEQAKGVLAERHAVPVDQAFELMRQHARRERAKLADVAADVVSGRRPFPV